MSSPDLECVVNATEAKNLARKRGFGWAVFGKHDWDEVPVVLDAYLDGNKDIAWGGWRGFSLSIVGRTVCDVPLVSWRRLICDLLIQKQQATTARLMSTEEVLGIAVRAAADRHKHAFGYSPGTRNLNRLGTVVVAVRATPRQGNISMPAGYGGDWDTDYMFLGIRRGPLAKVASWNHPPKDKIEKGKRAAWLPILRTWPEYFEHGGVGMRRIYGRYERRPWVRSSLLGWIRHYRDTLVVLPLCGSPKEDPGLCDEREEPLERKCGESWAYRCLRHSRDFCEKHAWWHIQHNNCKSYLVRRRWLEADTKLVRAAHPNRSVDNA